MNKYKLFGQLRLNQHCVQLYLLKEYGSK